MATVTTLPLLERPNNKTLRAMTHPRHDPKSNGAKRRVKPCQSFDPEDLTRRLEAHLAEQKLKAQRRRQARAAKSATTLEENGIYHHVPKVAAAAFERTTSPDTMGQVHKLAQPALKVHLEVLSLEDPSPGYPATNLQRTQAMDQVALEKEAARNRNQYQWTKEMENAAEADQERNLHKPPQRSFMVDFAHLKGTQKNQAAPRPFSTGDAVWDDQEMQEAVKSTRTIQAKPTQDGHDRHDWTQREDQEADRRKRERAAPFLRKMESTWIMISKKEKLSRDEAARAGDQESSSDGTKSGRGSFLARFKRHPS